MDGATVTQSGTIGTVSSDWVIDGVTFDGHIIWRNSNTGSVAIWAMNGLTVTHSTNLGAVVSDWTIVGSGDFDGNGSSDLIWRNSSIGAVAIWFLDSNGAVTPWRAHGPSTSPAISMVMARATSFGPIPVAPA
jgi:hypothetical protein